MAILDWLFGRKPKPPETDEIRKVKEPLERSRRALQFLDSCGQLTFDKFRKAQSIAGHTMSDAQLRSLWDQADRILPLQGKPGGKEYLRFEARNAIIVGMAAFEAILTKAGATASESGNTMPSAQSETPHGTDAQLKGLLKQQEGNTAGYFIDKILPAFQKENIRKAMRYVELGLTENPTHPKMWLWRGMLFFKECKYRQAVEALRKALELDPQCKEARQGLRCRELALFTDAYDRAIG